MAGGSSAALAAPGGDAELAASTVTVAASTNMTVTPMCSAGARAVGGGVQPLTPATGTTYNAYRIGFSAPVDETGTTVATNGGDIPRGWTVEFTNIGGSGQFRVYAICSLDSDAILSEFTLATTGLTAASVNERSVACPTGSRAVGGGVGTTAAVPASPGITQPYSYTSVPVDAADSVTATSSGDVPRGWRANAAFQSASFGSATLRFYAVCSASSDATLQVTPFTVPSPGGSADAVSGAVATCPTGTRVLSGGVASDLAEGAPPNLRIQRSGPLDATSSPDSPAGTDAADVARSWYGAERYQAAVAGSGSFRTIAVCATDAAVTPPPTGDTTPPDTIAGKGPKRKSTKRKAKFTFSSEPGASFECKLDGQSAKPCTSPAKVKGLKPGKHTFTVTAIDAAGNRDASPAVFRFKVKKKPK